MIMNIFKSIRTIARIMTLLISIVIVGVSLTAFNNVINEVKLSDADYNAEEHQLMLAADEIHRNVDYYIENERALFERNLKNELFYLLSYREVKYGESLSNLSSFLHYKEVEDILFVEGDQTTDHNPLNCFFEEMEPDERQYMLSTLKNNVTLRQEGNFYYYWPSRDDRYNLERKVVYYKTSEQEYTMAVAFKTRDYNEIIRQDVIGWLESVYADEVLIYDIQEDLVINDGLIENFNLSRAVESSEEMEERFIYEQDGMRTRIILVTTMQDLDLAFAHQLEVTDYSNVIIMTLSDRKVILTIALGITLIILLKLLEYAWIKRVIDQQFFDKRFIYETLEFCRDGVAVLDSRFVIEDCNDRFKTLLGLDVLIKDNYNLKKMIPEFKFIKESYNLVFMNKKSEYIDGDVIVKKIGEKYIVKIARRDSDSLIKYMDFKTFSETVVQRMSDRESFVENTLFAMISVENGIRIDFLMGRLRSYFNSQGLITLMGQIGPDERVIYVEGLKKTVFDNTFDNMVASGDFTQVDRIHYASIQMSRNQCPLDMDYIMEELDYRLYENKKE